jgi:hypothetical protein
MRRLLPLALVLPLVASGCLFGGGSTHYTLKKSTPCLKKQHKLFPLSAAKGKSLGLESLLGLDSPGHIVAFYTTDEQAQKAQVTFNHQLAKVGAGGTDTVETQHNVMIVLPSDDRTEDQSILDCLK